MNDKQDIVRLWSILFLFTIVVNIVFFAFIGKIGYILPIVIGYPLIVWDVCAFVFWILSFNIKYKTLTIEGNKVEVYAGFINHYIKVNNELKDEYKSSLSFTAIKLSCLINNHKLEVTISTSNHIVIKLDEELIA